MMISMTKGKKWLGVPLGVFFLGVFTVSLLLIVQAKHKEWMFHLTTDVNGFYHQRASYFFENKTMEGVGKNEYMPGALAFFVLLSPIFLIEYSREAYMNALIGINVGLFALWAFLVNKKAGILGWTALLLMAAFSGSIVLYRFEFFVMLFVVWALHLFGNKRWLRSHFVLGVATMIKIFPLIILPYTLILSIKKKGWVVGAKNLISFGLGVLIVLGFGMVVFDLGPSQVWKDMQIHAQKPVHVESVAGNVLTLRRRLMEGEFLQSEGKGGIVGIRSDHTVGPLWIYNYMWIWPWLFYVFLLWFRLDKKSMLDYRIVMGLVGLFLVFSKILTPQYLLWMGLLFPFIQINIKKKEEVFVWLKELMVWILLVGLGQLIYPLYYNALIGIFFQTGKMVWIFALLVFRNMLLIGLVGFYIMQSLFLNQKR